MDCTAHLAQRKISVQPHYHSPLISAALSRNFDMCVMMDADRAQLMQHFNDSQSIPRAECVANATGVNTMQKNKLLDKAA